MYHLFQDLVAVNVIAVLPSVLMGIGGGVLGSAFTHVNLIFAKWRKDYMAKVKSKACSNLIRLLEPICILTIMTTIHVFLPQFLGCTEVDCTYTTSAGSNETPDTYSGPKVTRRDKYTSTIHDFTTRRGCQAQSSIEFPP